MNKRIICLANSRKSSGKCVAGKELETGKWIRPVSRRYNAISFHEECLNTDCKKRKYNCETSILPDLLDIIDIGLMSRCNHNHHQENYYINNSRWVYQGEYDFALLDTLLDTDKGHLWHLGSHSGHGLNDRVPESYIDLYDDSLRLIKPETFKISVSDEGYCSNTKIKVRGKFKYLNQHYHLVITDSVIEEEYLAKGVGDYSFRVQNIRLCISLAEIEWSGHYYKLIAAIIRD